MPHDSLQQWSDKPWKLRAKHDTARAVRLLADPGTFDWWISDCTAVSDNSFDHEPSRFLDDFSLETNHMRQIRQPPSPVLGRCDDDIPAPILTRNHDETPDGHRVTLWDADPGLLPHWWSQLRSLHDRLGVTECLEEGKVIYVCSWYLHGHNLRRCRHHRVLRLDPEWTTWLDIIKETWQDLLLRDQPVELGLVSPHPPAQVFQGHVAHLILSQDLDHVAAHVGIVSAIYRHTGGDIIVQNAHVLPMTISKEETIDLIPARPQCTIRHCDVQVGNTPAQGDVAIPVIDYTSIVVDIFPLSDDVDDFSSFMAAGTRHRPQPVDPHLMDRPTIARQEEVFDEEADAPDTNSTESEEDPAWSHSAVFSVHAPPNEGYVNTVHDTNGPLTRRNVARLAGFNLADLQTVHSMPVPPRDLRERGMRAFLAQHRADLPCGSRLAFVLIDVEFHPQPPSWDVVRARCPIYVPTVLSRHQILRAMDVYLYAQFVQDTCLVWHYEELIHQDQGLYARIYHGDYLRIALPPPLVPMPNVPTRCIARLLQMGVAECDIEAFYWISDVDNDLTSMPTDFSVIEDVQSSDSSSPRSHGSDTAMNLLQVATTRVSKGKLIEHHRCEDFAALKAQYCAQSGNNHDVTPTPGQEQLPWFESELRQLWHAHAVQGPGGMERLVKVLTWYNDHHRHQICAQPREAHLFDDPWEWRALLTRVWADHVDPAADVHMFVVEPRPLYGAEDIVAHVILVQNPLAHFKSLHVAVMDDGVQQGYPRQWVLIMPTLLRAPMGIDIMGYSALCNGESSGAVCSLWHGDREIDAAVDYVTMHGYALTLYVQRHRWPNEVTSFASDSSLKTRALRKAIQLELLVHDDAPEVQFCVQLFAGVHFLQLPDFIELSGELDQAGVEAELKNWGHDCRCVLFKEFQVAVCYLAAISKASRPAVHLYLQIDPDTQTNFIVDTEVLANNALDHMRFLYGKGYWRACIQSTISDEEFPVKLHRFYNCTVLEAVETKVKSPLPWPVHLPQLCSQLLMPRVFRAVPHSARLVLVWLCLNLNTFSNRLRTFCVQR